MSDDDVRDTPPAVIGAVAAGTGPLPFLAVYATIFISHGGFHHVVPPDVTSTSRGELYVGLICLAVFLAAMFALWWMLNGHRRWPFVLVNAGLLAVAVDFLVDKTKGGPLVSVLVAICSFLALVLCSHPQAWDHVGRRCPRWWAVLFGRPTRTTPGSAGPAAAVGPAGPAAAVGPVGPVGPVVQDGVGELPSEPAQRLPA